MPLAPRGDAVALARALVAIDSRNPSLVAGAPGERACAEALAATLTAWGFRDVELQDSGSDRPNVIARLGPSGGRSLILNGHLDVVGTEGMTHAPFAAELRDGRLWGRGAADMKGGVAAMCAASVHAFDAGTLAGEVIITAVTDEEWKSQGTRAVIAGGVRADAAIVTEPTALAIGRAHKGFAWLELTVHGVAAHGSAHTIGVDAITHAALVLAELDAFQRATLATRAHPLLGPASLHASTIAGGSGLSTYPDRCVVHIERRTLPGEAVDAPLREVQDAISRAQHRAPELRAEVVEHFAQPPSEVDAEHAVVRALDSAIRARGDTPRVEGFGYWTDAALFTAAGVPAVLFGPGDIGLAHSATEWIALEELERGTQLLADAIGRFFNA